jgi:hypothetical protein
VAQDHTSKSQVGVRIEQDACIIPHQHARPKRHDLHETARTGIADRTLAEVALHLDKTQHQIDVESGAFAVVPDRLQKVRTLLQCPQVRTSLDQAIVHFDFPAKIVKLCLGICKHRLWGFGAFDRGAHGVAHRIDDRLFALGSRFGMLLKK